jgi:hypothetical protein
MNRFCKLVGRRDVVTALTAIAFFPALTHPGFTQGDPLTGTWKLNLAKSTYNPGPAPKAASLTYRSQGQNVLRIAEGVDAEGKPTKSEWTHVYDGKPYATPGVADYDTSSYTRVDPHTVSFSRIRAGKAVQAGLIALSADGRTMTITTAGTNAKGQQVVNVAVYDKQ